VNFESGPLLTATVQSIRDDTSAGPSELVVVDNGSTDGSVAKLREALPDVHVITPPTNAGYAAGANRGIAATRSPIVAICNSDIHVVAGTANALVSRLEAEDDLGAIGPALENPDGTRYPSARVVPRLRDAIGHGIFGFLKPDNRFTRRYRQLDADPERPRDVDWVSGAAVWLRRSALEEIGGWDEGYFMYVEDVDLCSRLRSSGWRIAFEPSGRVVHIQGASAALRPKRMIVAHHRSLFRFAGKRWRGWRRILLVPAAVFLGARATVLVLISSLFRRRSRPSSPQVTE
jgi:N-acetylglucosaminyl-diphospho-decaprenol L-rhamnosyltransferase